MWKKIKGQMGSNPGGLYEDESGIRWYVKFLASRDRMMNELLANKLYELAGIRVPESKLVEIDGKNGLASKYNPSLYQGDVEDLTGGREGFAIDAWLANWDVIGMDYDNMLVDENKQIHRIDPGGALDYRAQGGRKGPAFGDEVSELDTLRNPDMNETAHSVFGDMSNAEIRQSIDKVLAIPDNEIKRVVMEYGPSNKQELLKKLLARKKYLKKIKPKFASRFLNRQAFVKLSFVSKCPGHRNSKGELAEWCVKSHDTGEIISSHKTKAQAKEHLKQMHIHKGSANRDYFRAWHENRLTKNPPVVPRDRLFSIPPIAELTEGNFKIRIVQAVDEQLNYPQRVGTFIYTNLKTRDEVIGGYWMDWPEDDSESGWKAYMQMSVKERAELELREQLKYGLEHNYSFHKKHNKKAEEIGVKIPKILLESLKQLKNEERDSSKNNVKDMIKFLRKKTGLPLRTLGSGSSRIVFRVNEQVALKMAAGDRGIAQNRQEYSIYEKVETCSMITRIFYYDPEFEWMLVESVVREASSAKHDFEVYGARSVVELVSMAIGTSDRKNTVDPDSIRELKFLINKLGLDPGDLYADYQWGIVQRKGQEYPVLLDYGLTEEVYYRYYH